MRLATLVAGFLLLAGSAAYAASPVTIQDPSNVNRNMTVNADGSINTNVSGSISATNPSVGANSSAAPTSSTQVGVSDGTNLQPVIAPIGLGDGVNGNNMVSTGGWVWNGTTWDRMPGTAAGGVVVSGPSAAALATSAGQTTTNAALGAPADAVCGTATGTCDSIQLQKYLNSIAGQGVGSTAASVPAQALYMGCRGATTNPTAVTDGQLVGTMCSKGGKVVVDLFAPSDLRVRGKASATDGTAHTIIAAGAGSLKTYITDIQCSRNDTGTSAIDVTFSDDQSTSMTLLNAGNGGVNNWHLASPLVTAAAAAFAMTVSTGTTTVKCSAQGYQAP